MKIADCGKVLSMVLAFAVFAVGQTVWNGSFADTAWYTGDKSQDKYTITTAEQLAGLSYLVTAGGGAKGYSMSGKVIALGRDIALNALSDPTEWQRWGETPPANKWKAIGDSTHPFQGVFDGGGFVVRGVYIDTAAAYQGFFGFVSNGGSIKRLRVAESYIKGGGMFVGGLAGGVSGTITDCYATGKISGTGTYVGGLVGLHRGSITNSFSTGDVSGLGYVGGLVGMGAGDTIKGCYATGSVVGLYKFTGGLVGLDSGYMIINSYATGNVSGDSCAGGLAGGSYAAVTNSYAIGNVTGRGDYIGGLVGRKYVAAVTNCYAAGAVSGESGNYTGGLVGYQDRVSPDRDVITFGYYNITSGAGGVGIPKTAAYMKSDAFMDALNTGAYALSAGRWNFAVSSNVYPTFGGGNVPASHLSTCFSSGDGSSESTPYMIKTAQHLANLSILVNCGMDFRGKYLKLEGNVSLRGGAGNEWVPIGQHGAQFKGAFMGGGFFVDGVYINNPTDAGRYVGLFGRVAREGSIRNLRVSRPDITGYCYVGGLAGKSSGTITKCCVDTGKISAAGGNIGTGGVGGLVGSDSAGTITNCRAVVEISGSVNMVGGLVGWNSANGKINGSYAKGRNISVVGDDVGGLVGRNDRGSISDCYADYAEVSGGRATASDIGGGGVGGLVGTNVDAVVTRCYTVAAVSGRNSVGGLAGLKLGTGRIDSCYYKSANAVKVGNDYGAPRVDADMKTAANYIGWDFDAVWGIDDKRAYPYLIDNRPGASISVLSGGGAIPKPSVGEVSASVSVPAALTAEFSAGPNPVVRNGGRSSVVSFFRKGGKVYACELLIYDAAGNAVGTARVADSDGGPYKRKVGEWDLTDAKGRNVPEGTYLIRGVLVGADGKRERVSAVVGVSGRFGFAQRP